MADQNINYKITVDVESGTASLRDLQGRIVANKVPLQDLRKEFGNLEKTVNAADFNKFKSGLDKVTKSQQTLKNSMQQTSDKTGAATSAVLELGRVVQDAPYGIRGMANNITQLVSQMGFATKSAGGFTGALKQMGKAMLGPLGVVFAVSAVVSILDGLYGGQKKSEKSTEDLTEELIKQIEVLDSYASALDRGNLSLEEQSGIIKAVTVSNKEFKKIIESTNGNLDEQINALKQFRLEKQQQLELDTKISRLSEINQELDKSNIDTIEEATIAINKLKKEREEALSIAYGKEEEGITRAYSLQIIPLENIINQLNEQKQLLIDINSLSQGVQLIDKGSELQLKQELSDLKEKQSRVEALTDTWYLYKIEIDEIEAKLKKISDFGKTKGIKVEKVSPFKTKEELDIDIKNQENALLEFEKKIKLQSYKNQELEELASAKTEEQKSEIKRRYSQLNLEVELNNEEKRLILAQSNERQVAKDKHDNHVDELKRIFEEYKLKVELNDKLTPQQRQSAISDAKSKTDESIAQAGSELIKTNKEIDDSYNPLFKMFEELAKKRRDALGIVSEDKKTEEFDALSSYIESYKTLMSGVTEFINGEYERQLTIEQNKTNALNAELNNRLLNENLSKDERAKIQNEIARNDEALRIKQNEIAKKQFNTQKAFNIASATIDTFAAALSASKQTYGGPFAKIAAMTAVIGAGLANVAMIARQKFQPSAASTPVRTSGSGGSGGGGMADRSFNFNLVGNNIENQLANAIQGQFSQPLKAYVVSRDMSNQQQLDANIVDSARF